SAVVPRPWRPGPAGVDRQWLGLYLPQLSRDLSRAACRPPPHPALYAAHQRQSRALHSNGLARMGVCPAVLHVGGAGRDPARLARALQLCTTPCQPRRAAPYESLPRREQPHARSQLARVDEVDELTEAREPAPVEGK